MFALTHYIIICSIYYIVLGVVTHILDRKYGIYIYRKWYQWTHKDPLSDDREEGFIYNRRWKIKFAHAGIISFTFTVLSAYTMGMGIFLELIMFLIEVPLTMIGFALGPLAYRLWEGKNAALDFVDKVESGEIHLADKLTKEATELASELASEVRHKVDDAVHSVKEAFVTNTESDGVDEVNNTEKSDSVEKTGDEESSDSTEVEEEKPEKSLKQRLDEYKNGR